MVKYPTHHQLNLFQSLVSCFGVEKPDTRDREHVEEAVTITMISIYLKKRRNILFRSHDIVPIGKIG